MEIIKIQRTIKILFALTLLGISNLGVPAARGSATCDDKNHGHKHKVITKKMPAAVESDRFIQDRFAIGFGLEPPFDENMDARYAEIAEANFTVFFGVRQVLRKVPNRGQLVKELEVCEKYGLKAILPMYGLKPEELPTGPACWGYFVDDEPNTADFAQLREKKDAIGKVLPGRLAYINLFPSYATLKQLGAQSYEEHVSRYMEVVNPDVLCMDHYPFFTPYKDTRDDYCMDLEVMRKHSLAKGIPFWNFLNIMPFGSHFDPSEAQVRWQIYSSLAYGAKGVFYFCYWTPSLELGSSAEIFNKGGAIITPDGRRTRHYGQVKRINAELKKLGRTLMKLTSTAVYRVKPDDNQDIILKGCRICSLTKGDYLIGVFHHTDGRDAVMLNNYRFAYTAWPTVVFDVEPCEVVEVCADTGKESPVVDDSPELEGLQLSLDASGSRLFLLPPK